MVDRKVGLFFCAIDYCALQVVARSQASKRIFHSQQPPQTFAREFCRRTDENYVTVCL